MFGSCSNSAMGWSVSRPFLRELGQVELVAVAWPATIICGEAVEILLALAAADVDAESQRDRASQSRTPESATAFLAAPTANWVWRPWYFQRSGSSPTSERSQSRTSAEIFVGKLLASNSVM